jgi:hypothetical protein
MNEDNVIQDSALEQQWVSTFYATAVLEPQTGLTTISSTSTANL